MVKNILLTAFGILLSSGWTWAEGNPVILTVSGKIGAFTNKDKMTYEFRVKDFQALKQRAIVTKTSWTPVATFSGPLIRDILAKVGATGSKVKFQALNDYAYSVDRREFDKYNVILARSMNSKQLEVKERGPLWVMYPIADMPSASKGPQLDAKLVWQVDRIVVY
ncbi:molybdopterin-dependent oxidoreductase [Chromobacterium violaceum]|uniref:molybdopterin-dependent oxidoreductase n=1 Tax=Chromobacterium violaceum TaxID=536 RepID=UPI001CE225C9|nr:molybdopterin-dependent oxidoreductase [Chromobacterium violaceum]